MMETTAAIDHYVITAAPVATIRRLKEAYRRREHRLAEYKKKLADKSVDREEKTEIKAIIRRINATHKKHKRLIAQMTREQISTLRRVARKAKRVKVNIRNRMVEVPEQARKTVEKFAPDPHFNEAIDKALDYSKSVADKGADYVKENGAKVRTGAAALTASMGIYLWQSIPHASAEDFQHMLLTVLALAGG